MEQTGRNKSKAMVLLVAIVFLCSNTVFAAEKVQNSATSKNPKAPIVFDIAIGTELMSGDTTYSIGYPVTVVGGNTQEGYFPFSQLEWPLDIWLARVDAGVNIGSSWRINGTIKTNISDPSDPMIDKDWITASNPDQLDIYSDSTISDFNALILDFDVEWAFLQSQSWNLYAGLGYQYQKFEYDGQLIRQYSPSGIPDVEGYGDGSVGITYEMTYKMPYLLAGADFQITPNFIVAGHFSFSPFVDAQDEDHHLLRNKLNKGDMDGNAYMIDVSGTYNFLSPWFIEGAFHYTKIDVDGDQNGSLNGIYAFMVSEESESTQTSSYLKVGYKF